MTTAATTENMLKLVAVAGVALAVVAPLLPALAHIGDGGFQRRERGDQHEEEDHAGAGDEPRKDTRTTCQTRRYC